MLKVIDGLPSNVVGIEAVGEVDAGDYGTVMDPALEAALAAHEKVRFLYVLGAQFEGMSGGAMWEDAKVGVGHWNRYEKIALVTDSPLYRDAVKLMGWMVPGQVKTFEADQIDEAKAWVAG